MFIGDNKISFNEDDKIILRKLFQKDGEYALTIATEQLKLISDENFTETITALNNADAITKENAELKKELALVKKNIDKFQDILQSDANETISDTRDIFEDILKQIEVTSKKGGDELLKEVAKIIEANSSTKEVSRDIQVFKEEIQNTLNSKYETELEAKDKEIAELKEKALEFSKLESFLVKSSENDNAEIQKITSEFSKLKSLLEKSSENDNAEIQKITSEFSKLESLLVKSSKNDNAEIQKITSELKEIKESVNVSKIETILSQVSSDLDRRINDEITIKDKHIKELEAKIAEHNNIKTMFDNLETNMAQQIDSVKESVESDGNFKQLGQILNVKMVNSLKQVQDNIVKNITTKMNNNNNKIDNKINNNNTKIDELTEKIETESKRGFLSKLFGGK